MMEEDSEFSFQGETYGYQQIDSGSHPLSISNRTRGITWRAESIEAAARIAAVLHEVDPYGSSDATIAVSTISRLPGIADARVTTPSASRVKLHVDSPDDEVLPISLDRLAAEFLEAAQPFRRELRNLLTNATV